MALLALILAAACSDGSGPIAPKRPVVAALQLSPPSASLVVGRAVQLKATPVDAGGNAVPGRTVAWSSSDESVASVSAAGVVTGVGPGTADVLANTDGLTARAAVTVAPVPVAAVTIAPTSATVRIGGTVQLAASARDAEGTELIGRTVTWTTSAAHVANVTSSGLVTGLAAGSVVITATSEGRSATATVSVAPVPVASVAISPISASIRVGGSLQLTAATRDSAGNALAGRDVAWTSSDPAVATVSPSGVVSGLKAGAVTITASSEGQSATASLTVTFRPVTAVELTPATAALRVGGTVQFTVTLRDSTGAVLTDRAVLWHSSDTLSAAVSASGLVTGRAPGIATITVSSEGLSATGTVTITPVPVASIELTPSGGEIRTGETVQLTAIPRDSAGNALAGRAIGWSTSNPAVASVSTAGLVSGLAIGTATITASSEGKTATAAVTVAGRPDSEAPTLHAFTLAPDTLDVSAGEAPITVTLRAADAHAGVSSVSVMLRSPNGVQLYGNVVFAPTSGSRLDGTWELSVPIPRHAQTGTWVVNTVVLADVTGNSRTFTTAQLTALGHATTVVVQSQPDSQAPTLHSFSFTPQGVDVSNEAATFTATMHARDDLAGIRDIVVRITSPSGEQVSAGGSASPASGTRLDGTWNVTVPVRIHAEPGDWVITSIVLTDEVGNARQISTADLVSVGAPTKLRVTSTADTEAPTVHALSLTPDSVDVGAAPALVTAALQLRDDLAGVASVTVNLSSPSGRLSYTGSSSTPASGTRTDGVWEVPLVVPLYGETGNWVITRVAIVDATGNVRTLTTTQLQQAGLTAVVVKVRL